MAELASPTAKVTAAITTALAASTRPRPGVAASVTRIRPRRYSAVMNIAPTTATAISPANTPMSVCVIVTPSPAAPDTEGAMSPTPLTVNRPTASWKPPGEPAAGPPASPMAVPAHAAFGQPPRRLTVMKGPDALLSPPATLVPAPVACQYGGDVANRPPSTLGGSPVRVATPTLVQCAPSVES